MAEQEKEDSQTKVETPAAKEEKPPAKAAPPAEGEGAAKETKEKEERRPQNCVQCKKRLSRKQWYYRNGNYFCNKGCWKASKEKKAA